jgi:predicted lipid-binding transport protein (Tim44 family)
VLNRLRRRVAQRLQRRRAAAARSGNRPDVQAFLQVARESFLQMQAAWDRADLRALGLMTAEPLLQDLREQLSARGPGPNHTEVLELHARLLALEEMTEAYVASVEFSGMIRERIDDGAEPFKELWLLAKVKTTGHGWQLAGVQSLG